ncbi:MAG: hypothetical protein WA666_05580 [Nitrospirota bacterium]
MDTEKMVRFAALAIVGAVTGLVLFRLISAITAQKAKPEPYLPKKMGKLIRLPLPNPRGVN